MKEKQILAIIKHPGKEPEIEPLFENKLEAFQQAVGGYIETVTIARDVTIICNEEGRIKNLPYNCTLFGCDFYGPIMIVGVNEDEFTSIRGSNIPFVMKMFKEEKQNEVD